MILLGVCTTLLGVWAANLGAAGQPSSRPAVGQEKVDFSFQVLGINTTRQLNKTMDVFVRWRFGVPAAHNKVGCHTLLLLHASRHPRRCTAGPAARLARACGDLQRAACLRARATAVTSCPPVASPTQPRKTVCIAHRLHRSPLPRPASRYW